MKAILIWTYHRVLPCGESGAVSQDIFDLQLQALVSAGYEFINTADLRSIINGDTDPGKRKLTMLTFDDGWADNLIWATPILERYSAKAVMAVNTALVNPGNRFRENLAPEYFKVIPSKKALELAAYGVNYDSFLTWDELKAVNDISLWDIQAHANSHYGCFYDMSNTRGFYPDFNHWTLEYALGCEPFEGAPRAEFQSILSHRRTRPVHEFLEAMKKAESDEQRKHICRTWKNPLEFVESEEEFRERIRGDMILCKNYLLDKLDVRAKALFWPWGHYSPESIAAAQECGFDLLFTMNKDALLSNSKALEIPRIAAPATISRFKKQMQVFTNPVLKSIRNIFSSG